MSTKILENTSKKTFKKDVKMFKKPPVENSKNLENYLLKKKVGKRLLEENDK